MASSRAYIPSAALIRALSRPSPSRCPFALRSTTIRTLRSQNKGSQPRLTQSEFNKIGKKLGLKPQEPPTDHDLGGVGTSRIESIEWYEQDNAGNQVLIDRIANKKDVERMNRLDRMYEESEKDPNYDTRELYKASIDSLASNPNFADLRDELEELKRSMVSTELTEKEKEQIDREASASVRMDIHENLQELIDDPDMADVREEIVDVQQHLPEIEGTLGDSPEWLAILGKLEKKLSNHEAYQKMAATSTSYEDSELAQDLGLPDGVLPNEAEDVQFDNPEQVDALIKEMQELLTAMGGDPKLEKELENLRNEDSMDALSEDDERRAEVTFESLSQQLSELKDAPPPEELEEANVSPELQAKVDKILEDPNLMEKLALIKDILNKSKTDVTYMAQSAPDPLELDRSETTTLGKRLKIAENDPEHIMALRRLKINLLPPFNVSPALRSLNEALKLAYVGANDDVRRVLWRAYFKARTIPTLVQNISDDAWDMLWYSQAVTWGSNQNRQNHLRILLQDLESVGKDGPPTHPKSLAGEESEID